MMTKGQFAGYMAKLAAAYREQIDEATLEVYYERLGEYAETLAAAIDEAIEDMPRFPSIAELRTRALRIRRELRDQIPRLPPAPEETNLPVKELVGELKKKMGWQ